MNVFPNTRTGRNMVRNFCWLVLAIVLASCQRQPATNVSDKDSKGDLQFEVGIGDGDADDSRPRPERTPKTDPNLTDVGPTVGKGQLLHKDASHFQFAPGGKQILFSSKSEDGPTIVYAVSPDQPQRSHEITRVQQELAGLTVLDSDANQLLLEEVLPKEKGVISSDDLKRLWRVDRTKQTTREVKGPWDGKNFHLAEKPVSPDGRFIVIMEWRPRTDKDLGNYCVIHLLDDQVGSTQTIDLANQTPEPIDWVGSGKDLRLAFLKSHRWEKEQKQQWYLGEPETGKYTLVEKPPLVSDEWSQRISPDGSLVAAVEGNEKLTITDVKTNEKRSFTFHEDDRRFVHEESFNWVGPRYLLVVLDRLALVDIQTMKMSFPLEKKSKTRNHTFSHDAKWVLWQSAEGALYVSPTVMPPAT